MPTRQSSAAVVPDDTSESLDRVISTHKIFSGLRD